MRDLKFRAFDKFNEVYYYSDKFENLAQFFLEVVMAQKGENVIVVEQFTGLKDRNGVKIYEGDVVASKYIHGECEKSVYKIIFDSFGLHGIVGFHAINIFDQRDDLHFYGGIPCSENYELEIIGNIHQNPELMEK